MLFMVDESRFHCPQLDLTSQSKLFRKARGLIDRKGKNRAARRRNTEAVELLKRVVKERVYPDHLLAAHDLAELHFNGSEGDWGCAGIIKDRHVTFGFYIAIIEELLAISAQELAKFESIMLLLLPNLVGINLTEVSDATQRASDVILLEKLREKLEPRSKKGAPQWFTLACISCDTLSASVYFEDSKRLKAKRRWERALSGYASDDIMALDKSLVFKQELADASYKLQIMEMTEVECSQQLASGEILVQQEMSAGKKKLEKKQKKIQAEIEEERVWLA
jgi:hypothetical protein